MAIVFDQVVPFEDISNSADRMLLHAALDLAMTRFMSTSSQGSVVRIEHIDKEDGFAQGEISVVVFTTQGN